GVDVPGWGSAGFLEQRVRARSDLLRARVGQRRGDDRAVGAEEHRRLDLRGDLLQLVERPLTVRHAEETSLPHHARGLYEVLCRSRYAPRRNDRLLRAPLVRATALPRARRARLRRTRG